MANTNQNTTTVRLSVGANNDNTYRQLGNDYQTLSGLSFSGTTYSYQTSQWNTVINLGTINSTIPLTIGTATPQITDKLEVFGIGGATTSVIFDSNVFNVQTSNTQVISAGRIVKYSFTYTGNAWIGSGFTI